MVAGCSVGSGGRSSQEITDGIATGTTGKTTASTGAAASSGRPLRLPRAAGVRVPAGFRAQVYARGLHHPTAMAFGPDGRLYVTEDGGRLVRVRPGTTSPHVVVTGLATPLGLAWVGRKLYVSEQGTLTRLRLSGGRVAGRRTVVSGLPFGLHQQDNVVLGPDGRLYLGSGSTCDDCEESDPRSAAVLVLRPDGTGLRVFSRGLRNPYGLAFQPGTGRLYVSVNGRDDLPNPSAPEPAETVVVAKQGRNFGWPACWSSIREHRMKGPCAGVTRPIAYLEEHSSADGIAFYTGSSFPARFRGNLFVALWGQYYSHAHGRRVVRLVLGSDGEARAVRTFVRGLPHPLALAVEPRGGLLVADWERGAVYRIQATGKP